MRSGARHSVALAAGLTTLSLAVAALGEDGATGQASSGQVIEVHSLTLRGKERPVHVVARGPISGIGTVAAQEAKSDRVHQIMLRLDGGTVRLTLRLTREGEGWRTVNRRTCSARRFGRGRFTITGGTGPYEGASGTGEFTEGGIAIAQRTRSGRCLGAKTPLADVVFYVKIRMAGDATVRAS